jgi:hypothetical protein
MLCKSKVVECNTTDQSNCNARVEALVSSSYIQKTDCLCCENSCSHSVFQNCSVAKCEATSPGFQVISSCKADWLFLDEQSLQVWL